jgi:hypothetical protein
MSIAATYVVCIPIDEDKMESRPLLDFRDGDIQLMGQTMGSLTGHVTLGRIHTTGITLCNFLCWGSAVEGALRNLSVEDFGCFMDKLYSNGQINNIPEEISSTLQRPLELISTSPLRVLRMISCAI